MDGKTLYNGVVRLIDEIPNCTIRVAPRATYDFLYEAACTFIRYTACLKSSQTITMVADQTAYDLNADFLAPYWLNDMNERIVRYYDGSNYSYPTMRDYGDILRSGNTTSVTVPYNFALITKTTQGSQVTGTTTSAGAATAGASTLTQSTGTFLTTVSAGDEVYNTTDGSSGVVMEVTSNTALVTALFDGGDNEWGSGDAFVITPQPRKQIVIDPPPSTAGHTVMIPYLQKPSPVYSERRSYRIDNMYASTIEKYAAWLYLSKEGKQNFGAMWREHFEQVVREAAGDYRQLYGRHAFRVNMKKRSLGSRSYR